MLFFFFCQFVLTSHQCSWTDQPWDWNKSMTNKWKERISLSPDGWATDSFIFRQTHWQHRRVCRHCWEMWKHCVPANKGAKCYCDFPLKIYIPENLRNWCFSASCDTHTHINIDTHTPLNYWRPFPLSCTMRNQTVSIWRLCVWGYKRLLLFESQMLE